MTTIAIRTGLARKRNAIIPNWESPYSHPLPKVLNDAETASWAIILDEKSKWIADVCKDFADTWLAIETFGVDVYTTNGGRLTLRPEKAMRTRMHDLRKAGALKG